MQFLYRLIIFEEIAHVSDRSRREIVIASRKGGGGGGCQLAKLKACLPRGQSHSPKIQCESMKVRRLFKVEAEFEGEICDLSCCNALRAERTALLKSRTDGMRGE